MYISDYLPCLAVKLQTLAEKMSNTIYRAAKVCSYQSVDTDKLLIFFAKIYSLTFLSIHLMYKISIYSLIDL
jgi:hypothetical protein